MSKVGPFFKIKEDFIFDAIDVSKAEQRADKLDNPYSHEDLFDKYYQVGDYIDHPRGRVVFDITTNTSIVYIDKCINDASTLETIKSVFEIDDYRVEYDLHYHCALCIDELQGLF